MAHKILHPGQRETAHGPLVIGSSARATSCFLTCLGPLIACSGDTGDLVKLREAQHSGLVSRVPMLRLHNEAKDTPGHWGPNLEM